MINVEQLLNLSVRLAAPVILICLGGLFSIKVDIFNLALEGFTLFGCFAAVVGTYMTQSVAGGIAFAVLVTLLIALIYALFVFELDVDPIICALACTTIATGLTRYLLVPVFGVSGRFILPSELALPTLHFELLEHVPMIGPILNDHSILVYLALILPFAGPAWAFRSVRLAATPTRPRRPASACGVSGTLPWRLTGCSAGWPARSLPCR